MACKSDTFSATRKVQQVRLQHPVLNHMAQDTKKEGSTTVPVVTSVPDKAVMGFSTPPISCKKSRER